MTGRSPAASPSKRQRINPTPAPLTPDFASRVIIALDLDAFYVSACRKRDPSLVGIPIGIQQKALVATISYEARAAGVGKLDSIKDALKKCPDMVLVNGEDLTYFRQVSSQVWRLVRSIVWGKRVEKLGMDELFCDVTEMVDHHLASCRVSGEERWFELSSPDASKEDGVRVGFGYKPWPSNSPGHLHPDAAEESLQDNQPDWWQERMLIASQLALYIRGRISNEVGLTCSAGIAPSKSLAKLVGALNKPNQQTTFCPPIGLKFEGRTDEARLLQHVNHFLDPLDLRKLPGFGRIVVDKIRDHLHPEPKSPSAQRGRKPRSNFMEPTCISDDEEEKPKVKVTVGTARKMLSLEQMVALFGEVIGPRLWALVCGRDAEPVVPAPDFPLQLSIEDTYPYPSLRGSAIHAEISRLSLSLLRRLELELIAENQQAPPSSQPLSQTVHIKSDSVIVRDYQNPESSSTGKGGWLRYPMKLRLSVRQGWSNRVSKQTKMPVEIFDLEVSMDVRAAAIAKACRGLLRTLIGGDDVVGDGMNLINIAALELSERRPQRALGSFFAPEAKVQKTEGGDQAGAGKVDEAFLATLPSELRDDIAREYGLILPPQPISPSVASATEAQDESRETAGQKGKGKAKAVSHEGLFCRTCGEEMQVWMQHDHELYPFDGLPSGRHDSPEAILTLVEETQDEYSEHVEEDREDSDDLVQCDHCGEYVKSYMLVAHHRFHQLQAS